MGNESWRTLIPPESILRIRVYLSTDETRAVCIESVPFDGDEQEFHAIRDELHQPAIVQTEPFGKLQLDRQRNCFRGVANWNELEVRVTFVTNSESEFAKRLPTARVLWSDQKRWDQRIKHEILKSLLDVWNEEWRPEELQKFTPAMFLHLIALESVSIQRDGDFQFCYDDGNLFGGHVILVRGNVETGKLDAHIAG